ncbi:hypothetical protein CCP3SC1AL1_2900005 [Gammaproteobacteria bacterium]
MIEFGKLEIGDEVLEKILNLSAQGYYGEAQEEIMKIGCIIYECWEKMIWGLMAKNTLTLENIVANSLKNYLRGIR